MDATQLYKKNRRRALLQLLLLTGIIVLLNVIVSRVFYRIDLTQEKRYSISTPTKDLLRAQNDIIFARVYLAGNLTPNLQRLQQATTEMLDQFKVYGGDNIQYDVFDPFSIPDEQKQTEHIKELEDKGVLSVQFFESATDEASVKYVFPFISLTYQDRELVFPLIDRGSMPLPLNPDSDPSVSISLLEYKFTKAIRQLTVTEKPFIAFLSGHGELDRLELNDLAASLNELYNVTQIDLEDDSTFEIPRELKTVIVAKPLTAFSEKGKFILDQYVMSGGNVLWLVDPVIADFDSLYLGNGQFMAVDRELNIIDMMVQYGARINSNIVQDKQCTHINVPVSKGDNFIMRPWPYNPVLNNYNGKHPVTKNVDAIEGKFVSTVDTLAVPGITKTILLRTSGQSRYLNAPARVNFNIVDPKFAPTDQQYNKPELPVAVLLEGKFPSAFRSIRPTVRALQSKGYGYTDTSYMAEGKPAKQIVIGDGDLIKNYVDQTGKPDMLGVNYTERYIFGNKDFAMNCIEYLCDQNGLIETRAKEVKLRPLDDQRVDDDRTQWQVVNMLAPLFLLYIFSGIYFFIRHRKYAA